MIIQHNMTALNTNRQLNITNTNLAKGTEKLASGYRINRAGDDAAGLSISEKMRGQIRGLTQASRNAQDGISLIQTAEGALGEIHSVIQRMRELTVQAANDTNVSADRYSISKELAALASEIDRIASQTEFNTMKLINGSLKDKVLQVGANADQTIKINIADISSTNLGVDVRHVASLVNTSFGITTASMMASEFSNGIAGGSGTGSGITKLIKTVNTALDFVSAQRSELGAIQNRLEYTISNADNQAENLQASESRIRDVNMAQQMVTYAKDNILQQAGQSMLAQANRAANGILALLQ